MLVHPLEGPSQSIRSRTSAPKHAAIGVHSSLVRHRGCSPVGTRGQRNTADMDTARIYCKKAPYASECTWCFALLAGVVCRSATDVHSSLVRHRGCSRVGTRGLTCTPDTNTTRMYC